jgi:hypothetical protein
MEECGETSDKAHQNTNMNAENCSLTTDVQDLKLEDQTSSKQIPVCAQDVEKSSMRQGSGDVSNTGKSQTASAVSVDQCLKEEEKVASPVSGVRVRAVLQQCTSARLAVQPTSEAENPESVEVG